MSEYRYRPPSGVITWLRGRAAALRDDSGEVVGFVGTITGISDRTAAEAARDRRAAELQAIYEAAPVGINVTEDPEYRVITGLGNPHAAAPGQIGRARSLANGKVAAL
jgi:PAS domain-containing protein